MDTQISDFRRTALTYFLLIAAASMGFCSFFLYEAASYYVKIQSHIIGATIIFIICVSIVLILFIRNIIAPVEQIALTAEQLSKGKLDVTMPDFCGNDVNNIGETLNDFAVDVQEVLLHIQSHSNLITETIGQIRQKMLKQNEDAVTPEIERDFMLVRQHIADIQDMIQAFDYFDVCLENGKLMSEKPPGTRTDSGLY